MLIVRRSEGDSGLRGLPPPIEVRAQFRRSRAAISQRPPVIRFVQIALLLAIVIPFAWLVKSGHGMLSSEMKWFFGGVPAGMAIMLALNAWDKRIRQRSGSRRSD
jgi:hypothetical protein